MRREERKRKRNGRNEKGKRKMRDVKRVDGQDGRVMKERVKKGKEWEEKGTGDLGLAPRELVCKGSHSLFDP